MPTLLRNLRYTVRMLSKNPGLTVTILFTLALGIGANTAIFTVDYATLLAPLPYPQPDQLVMVWSKIKAFRNGISAGDFTDWKRQNSSFQALKRHHRRLIQYRKQGPAGKHRRPAGDTRLLRDARAPFLSRPRLPAGRRCRWQEPRGDPYPQALVAPRRRSRSSSATPYASTESLIPWSASWRPGIFDRDQTQMTVPLVFKPEQLNHDFHWLIATGRLKPGVTLRQAQADMDSVGEHIAAVYPKSNKGWGVMVEPLKNDFLPSERKQTLWFLLGAVGFILLIACVNVANLLLARGIARQKELAVRSALGATRKIIFQQLLTESLLLSLVGGMLGIGVGYAMLRALIATMPAHTLPAEADLQLNLPILCFTVVGHYLGGPSVWQRARVVCLAHRSRRDAQRRRTLGHGSRPPPFAAAAWSIGEFALALTLLAGAGLAIHSFVNLLRVDLGLRTDHVLTFFLPVPDSRPKDPDKIIGVLPADSGAHRRCARRYLGGGHDRLTALRSGLWHALHHRRQAGIRRSFVAPWRRLWYGDPGLFQNLRRSPGQRPLLQRARHRLQRQGRGRQ